MFWNSKPKLVDVAFYGGPMDGLHQLMEVAQVSRLLAFPISSALFQLLSGESCRGGSAATSVAFYARHTSTQGFRYEFLRATSVRDAEEYLSRADSHSSASFQ